MKFKRTISAISALALTISCFAGLMITAKADASTIYSVNYLAKNAANDGWSITSGSNDPGIADPTTTEGLRFYPGFTNKATRVFSANKLLDTSYKDGIVQITTVVEWKSNTGRSPQHLYFAPTDSEKKKIIKIGAAGQDQKLRIDETNINSDLNSTARGGTWTIAVTLDFIHAKMSYTITDNKNKTYSAENIDMWSDNFGGFEVGMDGATGANGQTNNNIYLKSISATYEAAALKPANYKIEYKLTQDGEAVRTDTLRDLSGNVPTVEMKAGDSFKVGEGDDMKKYFYVSDNSTDLTIAEDGTTVVTVIVRDAELYNVLIKAKGDITDTLLSEQVAEGENHTAYIHKYFIRNSTAYKTKAPEPLRTSTNNNAYGQYYESIAENKNQEVEYETIADDNLVFYADLDDSTDDYANIRASNGSALVKKTYTSTAQLPAGTYTVLYRLQSQNGGSTLTIGDTTLYTAGTENKGSWQDKTSNDVTVTTPSTISFNIGKDDLDTILIYGTPNPSWVTGSGNEITENAPSVTVSTAVTQPAPVFGNIQAKLDVTKTYGVSVLYPTAGVTPKLFVDDTEVADPGWTAAITYANNGGNVATEGVLYTKTATYYVQFKASVDEEFENFGHVYATYTGIDGNAEIMNTPSGD